jgi:hypothetical protein
MRWMLRRVRMASRSGRRLVKANVSKEKHGMVWYSIEDTVRLVCFFANVIPKKASVKECACCVWYRITRPLLCVSYTMATK